MWIKILIMSSLIVLLCGITIFVRYTSIIANNIQNNTPYPFYNENDHLIAHAGGSIDGNVYTDSREAVEEAIKYGYKFIEIDYLGQ